MSFLEHLEELRKRLLLGIGGIGVAFFLCLFFSDQLWNFVFAPAGAALTALHVSPTLKLINPMDSFQIMWMKIPILAAVFLSSPWILYQVWAFIAPGLYKRERRWAAPFVISSAGLFIVGGLFAYFVAFRFGLEFLLGLGIGKGVEPNVDMSQYYDLFVDVMLGRRNHFRDPRPAFPADPDPCRQPIIPDTPQPLRNSGHCRTGRHHYAYRRCIQSRIVCDPYDYFVLHRDLCELYSGTTSRKTALPVENILQVVLDRLSRSSRGGMGGSVYYGYHFAYRWPFFVR